jgi:tRNA(Ile)-lysidine synthase TilS/MesJ
VPPGDVPAQGSIQDWARRIRYEWFQKVAGPESWIVLAHHADDLAETVLMRICRGAGLGGMPSMLPLKGNLWRPLLALTREDIQNLASRLKILHREDSSNAKMDYSRNRLRHRILPELEKLYPGVRTNLCLFSQDSRQWLDLLAEHETAADSPETWQRLQKAPASQRILDRIHREWGSGVQVSRTFLGQVYETLAEGRTGVFQIDAAHEIRLHDGLLELKTITQPISARWMQYRQSLVGSALPRRLGRKSRWEDEAFGEREPDKRQRGEKVSNDEWPPKKS